MAEQPGEVSQWQGAQDVLRLAEALRHSISHIDSWDNCPGWPDDQSGVPFSLEDAVDKAIEIAQALEALGQESRFSQIADGFFPGTKPELFDGVNYAMWSVFSFASGLLTRIGLGRFRTSDYPINDDYRESNQLVSSLKEEVCKLETVSVVVRDYLHSVARERLKRRTSDSGDPVSPTPPGTSYIVVNDYLSEYVDGGEWPVLCVDDLFPDDLAIIQELLQQELNKGGPPAYEVTVVTEASLSRKDLIAMRIKWKDFSNRASTLDFPRDPIGCAFIEAKKLEGELRRTDRTGVSQLRLPLAPGEKHYIAAPLGGTTVGPTFEPGTVEPAIEKLGTVDPGTDTPEPSALTIPARFGPPPEPATKSNDNADIECYVTLQQAAAMVSRSKRCLEGYKKDDPSMPLPRIEGGGGKPAEWAWNELRPWLEKKFDRPLPVRFPADRLRSG